MEQVSIVVPVYNSVNSLEKMAQRTDAIFQKINYNYELIFVDDCSPNPQSWQKLLELAEKSNKIKIIRLTRNFGQQAATLCGINEAIGKYIITMDDDLQHRPEDIPKLLSLKEHDIVIGEFKQKKHNLFKIFTSKLKGYFDYLIIQKPKHIHLSPFRLLNRVVVDGILKIKTPYPFIPAMMFYVSKDVVGVDVTHDRRYEGKSNYSLKKMIAVFSNLIINNSSFLLNIIGYVGVFTSFISFVVSLIIVFRKLILGIDVIGWASNMVATLFLGGLILFTLGIIGDYLRRIIVGIEHKPTYLIRQKKNI